jgi:Mg-chelatase subunit ChlD
MKPDFSQLSPEERDIRLTALAMGELSETEAAELRAAIAADPELNRAFIQRKRTMELLGETVRAHADVPADAPTRLSEDRRQKLLAKFAAAYVDAKKAVERRRDPQSLWYVPLSIAAILIALLGLAGAFIGGFAPLQRKELMAYGVAAGEKSAPGLRDGGPLRHVELARGGNAVADQNSRPNGARLEKRLELDDLAAADTSGAKAQALDGVVKVPQQSRDNVAKSDATVSFGTVPNGLSKPVAPPPVATPAPAPERPASVSTRTEESRSRMARRGGRNPVNVGGSTYDTVGVGDPAPATGQPASGPQAGSGLVNQSTLGGDSGALDARFKGRVTENDWDSLAGIPVVKQEQEVLRRESQVAVNGRNEFRESSEAAAERYDIRKLDEQLAAGKDFAGRGFFDGASAEGKSVSGGGALQPQQSLNYVDQLSTAQRDQSFGRRSGRGTLGDQPAVGFGFRASQPDLGERAQSAGDSTALGLETPGVSGGFGGGGMAGSGLAQNNWFFKQGGQSLNIVTEGGTRERLAEYNAPAEPAGEAKKKLGALADGTTVDLYSYSVTPGGYVNASQGAAVQPSLPALGAVDELRENVAGTPNVSASVRPVVPAQSAPADKAIAAGRPLEDAKALKETEVRLSDAEVPVAAKPATSRPVPQPEILTRENTFSTFSLNVADVSYKLAAASLERGVMPDPGAIRTEEFINAFDYRDPQPAPGMPVAFASERARYPFAHNRDVLRLAVKTAARGREAGKPLNIVILLDNSGSMERADRVRMIQECLRTLSRQFQPQDKLSVVTFARTARLWVDGVSGTNAAAVAEQVGNLTPQGGTNLEDALDLAYRTAARHVQSQSVSRVVLLTDGAANLGNVDPQALKAKVESYRKQGIALDSFGIGWEGYNDDLLETLTRNGDGRYGFLNTPEEAGPQFAGQLAGALRVAASDVKVQVEFNPKRVSSWRQLGYAKHQLTKEQFRDNTVDAAEIGAAEAGNALYVIETKTLGEGPIATVRVRYKVPGTSDYHEHEWPVPFNAFAVSAEQATPSMRLATSAAAFSEWLASSPYAGDITSDRLLAMMRGVPETFGADPRPKQLEWMIRQAKSISGK